MNCRLSSFLSKLPEQFYTTAFRCISNNTRGQRPFLVPLCDDLEDFNRCRVQIGCNIVRLQQWLWGLRPNESQEEFKQRIEVCHLETQVWQNIIDQPGFCLTEEPFHLPTNIDDPFKTAKNKINLFRLQRLDESFCADSLLDWFPSLLDRVTSKICDDEISDLSGELSDEALETVEDGLGKLNPEQQQLLNIFSDDLYDLEDISSDFTTNEYWRRLFYFGKPIEIVDVGFRKSGWDTFADVTVLCVCVYDYSVVQLSWPRPMAEEYGYNMPKVVFANYVFTRKVKPVLEEDWIISKINYIVAP